MLQLRFPILVMIVAISGLSQGLLLPLISMIFEREGISPTLNGFHATGIYIGIILASFFMEKPLRKYGYKPMLIFGGLVVVVSLAMFTVWKSFLFWFVLRLVIGIGDNILHFSTQTWITSFSPQNRLGRNLSIYGFFFSLGFAIGPQLTKYIDTNESLPFLISSLLSLIGWLFIFLLKNEFPAQEKQSAERFVDMIHRLYKAWKYAWVALLLTFAYGFLEGAINGSFPIYAMRMHLDIGKISALLTAFPIGVLLFQVPLGALVDKYNRKVVISSSVFIGLASFLAAPFFIHSFYLLLVCFVIAGMSVGSLFSLGLTYMTDLLPSSLHPAGNLVSGMLYSIGSICGPLLEGIVIQYGSSSGFFIVISGMLLFIFVSLLLPQKNKIVSM